MNTDTRGKAETHFCKGQSPSLEEGCAFCKTCKQTKPTTDFTLDYRGKPRAKCKQCCNEWRREYYKRSKYERQSLDKKHNYGVGCKEHGKYHTDCRDCKNAYRRDYYQKNKEREKRKARAVYMDPKLYKTHAQWSGVRRTCTMCFENKPVQEFGAYRRCKSKVAYRNRCKDCINALRRQRYKASET